MPGWAQSGRSLIGSAITSRWAWPAPSSPTLGYAQGRHQKVRRTPGGIVAEVGPGRDHQLRHRPPSPREFTARGPRLQPGVRAAAGQGGAHHRAAAPLRGADPHRPPLPTRAHRPRARGRRPGQPASAAAARLTSRRGRGAHAPLCWPKSTSVRNSGPHGAAMGLGRGWWGRAGCARDDPMPPRRCSGAPFSSPSPHARNIPVRLASCSVC